MKYPNNEKVWVTFRCDGHIEWIITSKTKDREIYFLYKNDNETFQKIAKSQNPLELEQKGMKLL